MLTPRDPRLTRPRPRPLPQLDIVTFANVSQLVFLDKEVDCPLRTFIEESHTNLVGHANRIKERFFPDWEEMCQTLDLNTHLPKPPPKEEAKEEEKEAKKEEAEAPKEAEAAAEPAADKEKVRAEGGRDGGVCKEKAEAVVKTRVGCKL